MKNIEKVQELLDEAQTYRKKLFPPKAVSRLTPEEREENAKALDELIRKIYKK